MYIYTKTFTNKQIMDLGLLPTLLNKTGFSAGLAALLSEVDHMTHVTTPH